jgi:Cd2+/Zn2+-exporting ATPase
MKKSDFIIEKMDCPTEEKLIRNRLASIDGIESLYFNLMERQLTVTHSLDDDKLIASAIGSLGMEARLKSLEDAKSVVESERSHAIPKSSWIIIGIAGVLASLSEAIALIDGDESSVFVKVFAVLSIFVGGRDTLRKGFIAIRNFTMNINFLMTVAIAGAVLIGQWPEAAMVTFLFGVAELIEKYSLERARNAIRSLMEMSPELATVRRGTDWVEVKASEVSLGEIVRVKPGERIPLDGVVTGGQSSVNQAPITGESIPLEKSDGDELFAGSINERGVLEFKVTANKGHTTLDRIVRAVQEAQSERAPTQRFVDTFSLYYTPLMVGLAVLVAVLPPLFFGTTWLASFYKALVLLVIACPCALVISTPVTIVSGLAAAAKRGILIKGGVYLEQGRRLRIIALDKTGTLTVGKPQVTDIVPLGSLPEKECLQFAASLDAPSEHPVASAIVSKWTQDTNSDRMTLLEVSNFESITGRGVKGHIKGELHYVGNHRLTEEIGLCGSHVENVLLRLEAEGKTAVVLSSSKEALAVFGVADTLRETSVQAVKDLYKLSLVTAMLTGDNQTTAEAIAEKVQIDDVRGGLLPEDKLRIVSELKVRYGHIGMVGDGINDAPALAKADIGFAMGAAGTDTALETADVAFMEDDLRKLPEFISLSHRAYRVLVQNISFAIATKLVFFGLAIGGMATLWMAVFADMGASLIVVFNGLRLLSSQKT